MSLMMRSFLRCLGLVVGLWSGAWASTPDWLAAPNGAATYTRSSLLVHAPEGVSAGKTVWLGLRLEHAPGWHSYWKNPGDSGLPTQMSWTLSTGATAGEIAWPTPRLFPLGDLANYGYEGTVLLSVPVQVDAGFSGTELQAKVNASWLVCRKECIPEETELSVKVPAAGASIAHVQDFEQAWASVPRSVAAGASALEPQASVLEVKLEGLPAAWRGRSLAFFPELPGLIEPGKPWEQAWQGNTWTASIPLSAQRVDAPKEVPLVVALGDASEPGVTMTAPLKGAWPTSSAGTGGELSDELKAALAANAARASSSSSLGFWTALLTALIGGMILNLMPCVFPVLSIKVLAFARDGQSKRQHRMNGLAYSVGVVLSFVALGALLLSLRAAGEQLGWGFQLQSPVVVAGLATLFTLIGLNLAGLFEVGNVLPSSLAGLQVRHPAADAFLTGILATAVASPCTAPFMGAALGLAISLPGWEAVALFAAVGMGMAIPFLLASWMPGLANRLPRPGAWMVTFRQVLAFPMFATVVWLLWVLGQQTGIDGVTALLMVLVALTWLVWALGKAGTTRRVASSLGVVVLAWLLWGFGSSIVTVQDSESRVVTSSSENATTWERWTPEKQSELLAAGRPVLVDFTAAWCVTCQYNKRNALSDPEVLRMAQEKNVALLRADWTRRDPAVTQALAALGRNGVPVYAVFAPGRAPTLLSEILSVEETVTALAGL